MLSEEEKEKIDYFISQQQKAKDKNFRSWMWSLVFTLFLIAILKGCAENML